MASWVFSTASLMAVSRAYCPRASAETTRQATAAASAVRFHSFLIVRSPCSATRLPQSAEERRHDRLAQGGEARGFPSPPRGGFGFIGGDWSSFQRRRPPSRHNRSIKNE